MLLKKRHILLIALTVLCVGMLYAAGGSTEAATTTAETVVGRVMAWYETHMSYGAIAALMALESSFIPIPSEIIISPAAYIASDPTSQLTLTGVILAATVGSLLGALLIYGLSAWVGRRALYRFADSRLGSALMLDSDKIRHAEDVFKRRSKTSVCVGRFLAGIRMVISIPAGLARMNLAYFALYTFIGSAVYNTAMALIGYLLHGQQDLIHRYSHELSVVLLALTGLTLLVFVARYFLLRRKGRQAYGLIGHPLGHSFSRRYFTDKFRREHINARYDLHDIDTLDRLDVILRDKHLCGLNVTIPYKEQIIGRCDVLDDTAAAIGAVNVLHITRRDGQVHLKGYNTDAAGFEQAIAPHLRPHHRRALILGTGGASKAVDYVLRRQGIATTYVSRTPREGVMAYTDLTPDVIAAHTIIVNATPLGMHPSTDSCPPLPYDLLTPRHLLFDLVYNPARTLFLQKGEAQGCDTVNGEGMLIGQAEAAWHIWEER